MHKKATINNKQLFDVHYKDERHLCTIEHTGKDEYHVYTEEGEGYAITSLNTVDIIELMVTGVIDDGIMIIKS